MDYEYELNTELFKVCTVILNSYRWHGISEVQKHLDGFRKSIEKSCFEMLQYGWDLIEVGTLPENTLFFITEKYERDRFSSPRSYIRHKDLRLVMYFIEMMQIGEYSSHLMLLEAMTDSSYKSHIMNWCRINEYDQSISYEQFIGMSYDELKAVVDGNLVVRDYYERISSGDDSGQL